MKNLVIICNCHILKLFTRLVVFMILYSLFRTSDDVKWINKNLLAVIFFVTKYLDMLSKISFQNVDIWQIWNSTLLIYMKSKHGLMFLIWTCSDHWSCLWSFFFNVDHDQDHFGSTCMLSYVCWWWPSWMEVGVIRYWKGTTQGPLK